MFILYKIYFIYKIEKEARDKLLSNVKKECKQLMEISVTRKCINEDNSCITSLCSKFNID